MAARKWLILTALEMEAKAIKAEFGNEVDLRVIGIRGKRFELNGLDQYQKIVLAGLGGALDPSLEIGDIVLSTPSPGTPGEGWGEGLRIREGKIYGSTKVIASPEEKRQLFNQTGCLAVDMESPIVEAAGFPFLHLRTISDTAADALPPDIGDWVDDVGNPKISRVAGELALHPGQIPAMIRLGKNSKLAARNLSRAVSQLIKASTIPGT